MNFKRKCMAKRIVSLFAAASMMLTVSPGITASASIPGGVGSGKAIEKLANVTPSGNNTAAAGPKLIITAADGGTELVKGTDYDYTYSDLPNNRPPYPAEQLTVYTNRKVKITNANADDKYVNARIVAASNTDKCNIVLAGVNIKLPYMGEYLSVLTVDGNKSADIILKDGTKNCLETDFSCGIEKSGTGRLYIACEHADESGHKCDKNCGYLLMLKQQMGIVRQSAPQIRAKVAAQ